MDHLQYLSDLLKKIPRDLYVPIALTTLGLILFGYGLMQYLGSAKNSDIIPTSVAEPVITPVKTVKNIQVDVEGGVFHPGVYTISSDSRLQDALVAAGGLSLQADRDFVAKHINLAGKLTDGAKIYIPREGEGILDGAQSSPGTALDSAGIININSASADQLDSLPGVGMTTAQKIIANRPYENVQDLLTKKVVGQKVFSQIKDRLSAF